MLLNLSGVALLCGGEMQFGNCELKWQKQGNRILLQKISILLSITRYDTIDVWGHFAFVNVLLLETQGSVDLGKNSDDNLLAHARFFAHLKLSLVDPLANLIELDLGACAQSLLQSRANLDSRHSTAKLERQLLVVQHALSELVALGNESRPKAVVVRLGNLTPNAVRLVVLDQIVGRVLVDGELAVRADDLGHVMLAGGHHARGEEVGYAPAPEFDDSNAVIDVLVLSQAWVACIDADGADALDDAISAKEPECKINVMHGSIDKYAARVRRIVYEVVVVTEFVAGLRAQDSRTADATVVRTLESGTVAGVEAARETTEDLKVWLLIGGLDDSFASGNVGAQGLLA